MEIFSLLHLAAMFRLIFTNTLFYFVLLSCGQNSVPEQKKGIPKTQKTNKDTRPNKQIVIDTSEIVIIPIDRANSWLFKDATSMELTDQDLQTVDKLLMDCIRIHNTRQDSTKQFSEYIDLKKYKRQYVAFIDSKGEKKVYVNCFCFSDFGFDDWKKTLVEVEDGGSCFFNVTINLTRLKYEQLNTNGYG